MSFLSIFLSEAPEGSVFFNRKPMQLETERGMNATFLSLAGRMIAIKQDLRAKVTRVCVWFAMACVLRRNVVQFEQ